jgi:hypothetical protein
VKERKLGASAAQELREKLNSSILGEMERSAPKHHVSLGELFVRAANEELGGESSPPPVKSCLKSRGGWVTAATLLEFTRCRQT